MCGGRFVEGEAGRCGRDGLFLYVCVCVCGCGDDRERVSVCEKGGVFS